MGCLVLSQFQASLLGGFLGSALGHKLERKVLSSTAATPIFGIGLKSQPTANLIQRDLALSGLLKVTQTLTQSQLGRQVDWSQIWCRAVGKDIRSIEPSGSEAAVAILPVALFCYGNSFEQDRQLQSISQAWWPHVLDIAQIEVMIALSGAVSFLCLGALDPAGLIPQVVSRLNPNSILTNQLHQVQGFIERRNSLGTVLDSMNQGLQSCKAPSLYQVYLDSLAISFAFYCFLDTPEDFSLTLLRAAHTSSFTPLTSVFSGMLSGVYNGLGNIPVGWRSRFKQLNQREQVSQVEPEFLASFEAVSPEYLAISGCEEKILQLGSQLFALWSGVYNPAPFNFQTELITAVASPSRI